MIVRSLRLPVALPHFYDATAFDPYYEPVATLGRAVTKLHADLDSLGLYRNRNELDNAERSFHDVFTKQFCVEIKTKVEDGIAKVRAVRDQDDAEAINRAVEALMQDLQQVGTAAYQQSQAQPGAEQAEPGAQGAEGGPQDDGDVVDGEFKQAE